MTIQQKTKHIARTGLLIALTVTLQWATKPFGQLVTGSCVNAVLASAALLTGLGSALFVAVLSPVFAWLLGIAPQAVTVPAIMVANAAFAAVLHVTVCCKLSAIPKHIVSALTAACVKFLVLYTLVVKIICGPASTALMQAGLLKAPMLNVLPTMFAWPQLITALIGCSAAFAIVPLIRKAIKN